jgi:integrase
MGRSKTTGLICRNGVWHIQKHIKGYGRLCESTGTRDYSEAERFLILRIHQLREATLFGVRTPRVFREAAAKYLIDNQHMPSISDSAAMLKLLDPFIGHIHLNRIHDGTLLGFVQKRRSEGVSHRTINMAIERVTRILRLAASVWRDESGLTWLESPPVLTKLDERSTQRKPYPLSWDEQRMLFRLLPDHLSRMALFKVNTGCREQEVCRLQWSWEVPVPELETSVFLIPRDFGGRRKHSGVKNGEDRLVVLNDVAKSVVDEQRGKNSTWVFPYQERAVTKMNDTAWKRARIRAAELWQKEREEPAPEGFRRVRVHDLKHTFGRRLRAAGVSFEDRQVLLGHRNESVTTHYSAPDIANLVEAANRVASTERRKIDAVTILRRKSG